MERLITLSKRKETTALPSFTRYLKQEIDWSQRLILILGHRGAGKTTLILQRMHEVQGQKIYLSLDDFHFEENRLALVIEELYTLGYRYFFLDEAHRYSNWSVDLKIIFDSYEDTHVVVSGSSILGLEKGKADLSRRAAVYRLAGLSFREFINLELGKNFHSYSLTEILDGHSGISAEISDEIDVLNLFQDYLQLGYFPFYRMGKDLYLTRLLQTTHLVLEMDIGPFEEIAHKTMRNMKKLLFVLSESVPFTPNILKLAEKLDTSRNTVLKILDLLSQAQILNLLHASTQGISQLQKPEKVYLQNSNLAFALGPQEPNQGNIRETFFLNQLQVKHKVTSPKYGDFMIDDRFVFEVGGASKSAHQIQGVPSSYLAIDNIKSGSGNRVPLWLFGFLY